MQKKQAKKQTKTKSVKQADPHKEAKKRLRALLKKRQWPKEEIEAAIKELWPGENV